MGVEDQTGTGGILQLRPLVPGVEIVNTVVIVPLITGLVYKYRVPTKMQGKTGVAAIDQIRTVDKRRFVKRLSILRADTAMAVHEALVEMFAL